MKKLVVATGNSGKMKEIRKLLSDLPLEITSLKDYENIPEIIEDGETFAENAMKKAQVISKWLGDDSLVMGEDSGIEIEALGRKPGIYSARYAGPEATDEENNQKMISELKNVPFEERNARYQCHIALVEQGQKVKTVEGQCDGKITEKPLGDNGFGYDPYFLIEEYGETFGQLDPSIKSQISHRAKAMKKLRSFLEQYCEKA